jgi:hypothetical protein
MTTTANLIVFSAILSLKLLFLPQSDSLSQGRPPLTGDQVVARLIAMNNLRASRLQHYTGMRHYHLEYHGFPSSREADMTVEVSFDSPDKKEFKIISESGSALVINRVFKRLLASEKESLLEPNRRQTALNTENYNFRMVESEQLPSGRSYLLDVDPRTDNKFLFRGKIWVDASDFAVAKIEAQPGKNPSFWTRRSDIVHLYTKHGDFWLPAQNRTVSKVRLGGTATLTIDYTDYKIDSNGK